MKAKALITGITGMVGSHLADFLLEHTDWDIYGMCRWRSPLLNVNHLLSRVNSGDRIFFRYGDLNDYISMQNIIDDVLPDYVFHLAAQSYPVTSFEAPLQSYDVNMLGTHRLLEIIKRASCDPVIHICSSSEVYGRVPKEQTPIKETTPFYPASPYAVSKIGTDMVGKFFADAYGLKCVMTRMFTHTGPRRGDVFAESTFAKQIAMIEQDKLSPVVKVGNLNSMRTWSDVRDAVRAYYLLVTVNPQYGEVYNIGGNYSCTVGKMLTYLLSISSNKKIIIEIEENRLRPIDADLQIPDTSKFRGHTSWKPEISFEKTMQDLLNYWRERISSGDSYLVR